MISAPRERPTSAPPSRPPPWIETLRDPPPPSPPQRALLPEEDRYATSPPAPPAPPLPVDADTASHPPPVPVSADAESPPLPATDEPIFSAAAVTSLWASTPQSEERTVALLQAERVAAENHFAATTAATSAAHRREREAAMAERASALAVEREYNEKIAAAAAEKLAAERWAEAAEQRAAAAEEHAAAERAVREAMISELRAAATPPSAVGYEPATGVPPPPQPRARSRSPSPPQRARPAPYPTRWPPDYSQPAPPPPVDVLEVHASAARMDAVSGGGMYLAGLPPLSPPPRSPPLEESLVRQTMGGGSRGASVAAAEHERFGIRSQRRAKAERDLMELEAATIAAQRAASTAESTRDAAEASRAKAYAEAEALRRRFSHKYENELRADGLRAAREHGDFWVPASAQHQAGTASSNIRRAHRSSTPPARTPPRSTTPPPPRTRGWPATSPTSPAITHAQFVSVGMESPPWDAHTHSNFLGSESAMRSSPAVRLADAERRMSDAMNELEAARAGTGSGYPPAPRGGSMMLEPSALPHRMAPAPRAAYYPS